MLSGTLGQLHLTDTPPCLGTVQPMPSKIAAGFVSLVAALLLLGGVALLVVSVTRPAVSNGNAIVNRDPNAPNQQSAFAGPTGENGITGIPREDGNGQDASVPEPTDPSNPDSASTDQSQDGQPSDAPSPPADPDREPAKFTPGSSVPADWPADVPFPSNVTVGTVDLQQHVDFLLYKKSSVALTGGEILEGLEREKWRSTTVGTPRSSTIVARKGPASLTVLVTDSADGLPNGWVSIRLIYQSEPPPEPEPTPAPTKDPLEGRA